MGKFKKLKEIANKDEKEMRIEEEISGEDTDSDEGLTEHEKVEERKRAVLWTNRERVLVLCSRGADARTRHLMNDIKVLLPHTKGDSKLDKQKTLTVVNEIAEMKNCTKVLYFESRKHKDVYLWMTNVENGPSVKFLVHNIHTMMEMKLSGNCLKASRPILSFDTVFDQKPHLTLIKHALMQIVFYLYIYFIVIYCSIFTFVFSTANHHPRSQPFIDHVFSFSVTPDGKIWFRNFQIVDDSLQLQEIGPRFVLETIRIFAGSFDGTVLYDNPDYESPNTHRREIKLAKRGKYIEKELHHKMTTAKNQIIKEIQSEKVEDPVGEMHDDAVSTKEVSGWVAEDRNHVMNSNASEDRYVKLNVGGSLYQTTVGTLTKHDTMLRAMFSGRMEVLTDSNGWVLIDRSGRHFGILLDFLRDGSVPLPTCRVEVEQILKEARYYLIQDLVQDCQSWLEALGTRRVDREPTAICCIPVVHTKAQADSLVLSSHKPAIKLLINRHNNKYSYTSQSDDNLLKNLELFEKLAVKFHDRLLFIKDVGSESSEVCQWKYFGKGAVRAEVCCTSIVYATDKKQTKCSSSSKYFPSPSMTFCHLSGNARIPSLKKRHWFGVKEIVDPFLHLSRISKALSS
uniref:Ribosome biogenesis protein BRX1 homolog n=1 Tax=Heterorhabditis bacteriophora TaxID=37862 RepID=A0A1I7X879_HETBA